MKVKKVVAFFLTSAMILSMVPAIAFAAGDKEESTSAELSEQLNFADLLKSGTYEYEKQTDKDTGIEYYKISKVKYCENVTSEKYQYMNIYVPAGYVNEDGSLKKEAVIGGYTADTAPTIFRNSCSGWMSSNPENVEGLIDYMKNGFVFVSCGARSRGLAGNIGKAPAPIIDLKAGIRYLRANDEAIPGDAEKIISVGGSGGGQMSSLVGATGNMDEYYSYLSEIGAAGITKEGDTYISTIGDDVYGCMAFYPISDLENADIAYAWMWERAVGSGGEYYTPFVPGQPSQGQTKLTEFQLKLQELEAEAYVDYINSLGLKDADGKALTLDGIDQGSYHDAILKNLSDALNAKVAEGELNPEEEYKDYADWLKKEDGKYTVTSILGFMKGSGYINTRNKNVPGFDTMDEKAENNAFGTKDQDTVHFSASVAKVLQEHKDELSKLDGYNEEQVNAYISDTITDTDSAAFIENQTYLMNATEIMLNKAAGKEEATVASKWRIRSGTADEHTSFTIGYNMDRAAEAAGADCDYGLVWGMPHGGEKEGTSTGTFVDWVKEIAPGDAGIPEEPDKEEITAETYLDYSKGVEAGIYTWVSSEDGSYYFLASTDDDGNAIYKEVTNRFDGTKSKIYQGVYTSAEVTNIENQTMLVYIPTGYLNIEDGKVTGINENAKIGNYTAETAPVVYENNCSGWMSSEPKACDTRYIKEGMIYVSAGARSRGAKGENGENTGKAPTPVADLKAGVIELRANTDILPGNTERIYSVGTSGGGQMSSILGASGNMEEYYSYMYENGTLGVTKNADGTYSSEYRDDVYGAQCYCPIADLENADLAYAWMWFDSVNIGGDHYKEMGAQEKAVLTPFQKELQNLEAYAFVDYINSLNLKDENGKALTLDGPRKGSYYEAVLQNMSDALNALVKEGGINPEEKYGDYSDWLKKNEDGSYSVTDMSGFLLGTGMVDRRNKNVPGFDTLNKSAENNAFGTREQEAVHYSKSVAQVLKDNYNRLSHCEGFEEQKANVDAYIEEALTGKDAAYIDSQTDLMNATEILLGQSKLKANDPAKRWRTRNGTADEHTSFTIAYNLCLAAQSAGLETDYSLVWDMAHGNGEGTSTGTFIDWIKAEGQSDATDPSDTEDPSDTKDPSDTEDPSDPAEPNGNGGTDNSGNGTSGNSSQAGITKTGDTTNMALPVCGVLAAGCCGAGIIAYRRKNAV